MVLYLVRTTVVSKEIAEELAQFGSVGLVSKRIRVYSLEMNPTFLASVEQLSFVESVRESSKGSWN